MLINKTKGSQHSEVNSINNSSKQKNTLHTYTKSSHYPFISNAQRFQFQPVLKNSPGPATYEQSFRQRHTSDYHLLREEDRWGVGKEFMWIVDKGRKLFETNNHWKVNIGPGKYEEKDRKEVAKSNWNKNIRFNYKKSQKKVEVGPGSYGLSSNLIGNRQVAASAFKSKSGKSYLQQVVREKIKLHESRNNPEIQFIKMEEEAEDKPSIKKSPKKRHGSPVFMSKIERLPKTEAEEVGPGSYILDPIQDRPKKRRIYTDTGREQVLCHLLEKHTSSKVIIPGPGTYNISQSSVGQQKIARKPLLGFISQQCRFKSSSLSDHKCPPNYYGTGKMATCGDSQNLPLKSNAKESDCKVGSVYSLLRNVSKLKEGGSGVVFADD